MGKKRWGTKTKQRSAGQSTLEYILILAAIIAAVALASGTVIKPAVNRVIQDSANVINKASSNLVNGLGM